MSNARLLADLVPDGLDDYEEGAWTPDYSFSTSGSVTTTLVSGTYVKVGDIVTIHFRIATSSISSPTGNATIVNLPFTSTMARNGISIGQASSFSSVMTLRGVVLGDYIALYNNNTNTVVSLLQGSAFANNTNDNLIDATAVYSVA